MQLDHRSSGILLHPTSLPGRFGIGDLGPAAYRFADFLSESGQSWWQMLPIGPSGFGHSPYDSPSAFAGNPLLISLDQLVKENLLTKRDLYSVPSFSNSRVKYELAKRYKEPLFRKAFHNFNTKRTAASKDHFHQFCKSDKNWLTDYALFCTLKRKYRNKPWMNWESNIRACHPTTIHKLKNDPDISKKMSYHMFLQYIFREQWHHLQKYCHQKGIGLIGDIPIYVAQDSSDTWSHPGIFSLRSNGQPKVVAGVPPDYFCKRGQNWGNPLYRWNVLKKRNYDWWIDRLKINLERFDIIRLDHFIGFSRYWEIPAQKKSASSGRWKKGPGEDFFRKVHRALGSLPLITEDLGLLTPEVEILRKKFNLPGIRVLQFAFGGDPQVNIHFLQHHIRRCIVYTGTHDNNTVVGWFQERKTRSSVRTKSQIQKEKMIARRFLGKIGKDIHWDMIRLAFQSIADTVIIPAQDILGLGSNARMNLPGSLRGNWEWRLKKDDLTPRLKQKLFFLTSFFRRTPDRLNRFQSSPFRTSSPSAR